VSWAHPKYGTILASASYDGKVFIWREANGQWTKVFEHAYHTASVNLVSWAPHESGCLLACASSDGQVSVLEFKDNSWSHVAFPAHGIGVNSVNWAPAVAPGAVTSAGGAGQGNVRRFVTGGSDNAVKIWEWSPDNRTYNCITTLPGHNDWVRDVAWAPTMLSKSYIASASQDKTVRIWTSTNPAGGELLTLLLRLNER
jgi:protein transport protein SEC13